ncbi:hypothetical protein ACFV8Z_27415 [Streptomyces sp. NPDC059837]
MIERHMDFGAEPAKLIGAVEVLTAFGLIPPLVGVAGSWFRWLQPDSRL